MKSHFIQMGVAELLDELLHNEEIKFDELDAYNHIRVNTNNFEEKLLKRIQHSIWNALISIRIKLGGSKIILDTIFCSQKQNRDILISENGAIGWLKEVDIERDMFHELFTFINLLEEYEEANIVDCDLRNISIYLYVYQRILKEKGMFLMSEDDMYGSVYIPDRNRINNRNNNKKVIEFNELFKKEYSAKLSGLFDALKRNSLIDDNNNWKIKRDKKEIAKFFYCLSKMQVLDGEITYNQAGSLKCFCRKFGIIAYDDNDNNNNEIKSDKGIKVTIKNLIGQYPTEDEITKYKKILKDWTLNI